MDTSIAGEMIPDIEIAGPDELVHEIKANLRKRSLVTSCRVAVVLLWISCL